VDSESNRHSFRFPKAARLLKAGEFEKVKRAGRSWHGKLLVLGVLETGEPAVRVGLITSKRVGRAVQRNKVRRRLREMFRLARPNIKPGLWIVLIARQAAAAAEFRVLEQEWLRLASRAAIFITPCQSSAC
jgi:ribonuclease P protein component